MRTDAASIQTGQRGTGEQRLRSLDVFRGVTILFMVLVNNGGGPVSYRQLQHSAWNGWTLTDCVFPSFLWIVGVAITLSLGKRLRAGDRPAQLLPKIIRRSVILYVLGLLIYVYPTMSLSHQRLLGVLQRIAICYLIVSLIYLYSGVRAQMIWIGVLFAAYWMMMTLIPVPGYGAGNLSVDGNFAHYVDRIVLGTHNYASTRTWDPEGIISTLPAIASTLLGVMAGHVLRMERPLAVRRNRLLLIGVCLIAAGLLWNVWLPINKKLWTDSFATFMAGLDFVFLAAMIWVVDERQWSRYLKPFLITGMNAIVVYVASEFLSELLDGTSLHDVIYARYFAPLASPENASLLWALAFTGLMYLLSYGMYRRGWFVRI
ncbi:MAG TPA: heparan-alpha-glucosaminide N-acetyltransferase domain-containing protein [Bryobacteraceae bacterium]|nr:heparan-alpha-glucosaminide N-acetyltransferase domain-containing protein [Bryobacteraceae bacterium]